MTSISYKDTISHVVINNYTSTTIKGDIMKEIHMSNHLKDTIARHDRMIGVIGIGAMAFAAAGAILANPLTGIVPFMAGAFMASTHIRKRALCRVGLKGENALRDHLREILTDEHTVIYNVPVEKGDIDCIIIGPEGLYAIEAKNHKGIITYTNNSWRQLKKGRNGNCYTGSLKNPSYQLISNIKWLKNYLARCNIRTWINGLIVFTNPDTVLSIDNLATVKAIKLDEVKTEMKKNDMLAAPIRQSIETHILRLMG